MENALVSDLKNGKVLVFLKTLSFFINFFQEQIINIKNAQPVKKDSKTRICIAINILLTGQFRSRIDGPALTIDNPTPTDTMIELPRNNDSIPIYKIRIVVIGPCITQL